MIADDEDFVHRSVGMPPVVTFQDGTKKLNLTYVTENQYSKEHKISPEPPPDYRHLNNQSVSASEYNKITADQRKLFLDILNGQSYHYDPVVRTSDDRRRYYNLASPKANYVHSAKSSPTKTKYQSNSTTYYKDNPEYYESSAFEHQRPSKDYPDPVPIHTAVNLVNNDDSSAEPSSFVITPQKQYLTLSPSQIHYTTDCIHPYFRNGKYLALTFTDILTGVLKVAAIEPLTVMEWHDSYWAISGNRRLYLYKKLEAFGLLHQVKVLKVDFVDSIFKKKVTSRNDGAAIFVHGEPYMDQKLDQLVVESMKAPWEKITARSKKTNSRSLRLELRNGSIPQMNVDDSERLTSLIEDDDDDDDDDFTPLSNTQASRHTKEVKSIAYAFEVVNDGGAAVVTFSQIPKESDRVTQRWKWARRICGLVIFLLCLGFVISIIHVAALIFKSPNDQR